MGLGRVIGTGLGDTARLDLGGDCGCGIGSAALCRGIRLGYPADPAESDLVVRVTVADRERAPGGSLRSVSSVAGISICIGAVGAISGRRRSNEVEDTAVPGRESASGVDGCVFSAIRGGRGETGREGRVSFRDRIEGGAVAERTVPSLNSCSSGCSVAEPCCIPCAGAGIPTEE
jgi:hypothetical protein